MVNIFSMKKMVWQVVIILCFLPIYVFASEHSVKDQCTYLDDYFLEGQRSDGLHKLRCFDGVQARGVNIDYKDEQCVRFVTSNTGEIIEREELDWPDCHKYREKAKSQDISEGQFFHLWFGYEKFKLMTGCRKSSAIEPYTEFVANPAITVYTTATRLEEAGKLSEAMEIFRIAENCCADEDRPLVRNHITILEAWLSKTEADQAIIEKYLLVENVTPPVDIIPLLRFAIPEDYWLARDTFFILNAHSKAEVADLLLSRIQHKNESLANLKIQSKQMVWVGLLISYLRDDNEAKALQILKAQLGITKPADQFVALADAYENLSEGNTKQGEYRSRAIINLQKSLDLQWDKGHADKLSRLLEAEQRIEEVVEVWHQIIKHDDYNIASKCSFIRFLLRYDRKDEAIAAIRELEVEDGDVFRLIVPELLEHELHEETVRFMQSSFMSNQFNFEGAAVFCLTNLAKALHHTGDKRGAVAALRDAESLARHNTMKEYQQLTDATKEIGQQGEAEKIGTTIAKLEQPAFSFEDQGSKKDPVTELITGMEFVWVPEGCFQMGYLRDYGDSDERPAHTICVDGFYLGKHEVTQEQYEKVMGINPSSKNGANLPVESVSWDDVQGFVREFAKLSGKRFRLPTEAEWEYAARSARGWRNEKYSGDNDYRDVAWCYHNSDKKPHPVGQKLPNGLGLYDMTGNVHEWCSDWYDENYYQSSPRMNPQGPLSGTHRVIRGGAWNEVDDHIEISNRGKINPDKKLTNVGFRLILPLE